MSWAQEHPKHVPLKLLVHLSQPPESGDATKIIVESIHHYFEYKAGINRLELRRLMREGWNSLLIGLTFLAACVLGVWQMWVRSPLAAPWAEPSTARVTNRGPARSPCTHTCSSS